MKKTVGEKLTIHCENIPDITFTPDTIERTGETNFESYWIEVNLKKWKWINSHFQGNLQGFWDKEKYYYIQAIGYSEEEIYSKKMAIKEEKLKFGNYKRA